MPTSRPFAYNLGGQISGTEQLGNLAIGTPITGFTDSPLFWNGPDEDLRYIIARTVPAGNQPNPVGIPAYVGFWGTAIGDKTDGSFLNLANYVAEKNGQPPFNNTNDALIWLNANGYWTNYNPVTPTPTETSLIVTPTPTETSVIPTPTPTPTATDLSSITTYTISSCSGPTTLVVDLGPGFIVPGDVLYFTFSGITLSGCYSVVGKINSPTDDSIITSFSYADCLDCETSNVTPTPTETSIIPTPTPTETSIIPTPTPTETSIIPTPTPTPSVTAQPVTGYGFNLIALPYNFPLTGNTIMNNPPTNVTGSTNPNLLNVNGRGLYFNAIDMDGVDRTGYFSQFTGQSITITISQIGSTAIYSGDSKAFQSWSGTTDVVPPGVPGKGFVFGAGLTQPGYSAGTTTLIQSATTNWVTGQTVYISAVINGVGVTPTPTSTSLPVTPTPTSTNNPTPTPTETSVPVTPTTTPTPTPTNPALLQMLNETTGSRTITSLTLDGITQPLSSGSYPITAGNNGFALTHGTNSNPNGVVFNFSGSGTFDLYSYLNGTLVNYLASYNNNTYTMGGTILQSSDQLLLRITDAGTLPTPTPTITPTQTTVPPTPTPSSTSVSPTPTPTAGIPGDFNVTVSQQGPNVVWEGSGIFNLGALSLLGTQNIGAGLQATQAIWAIGPITTVEQYGGASFTTYPTSFGVAGSYPSPVSTGSTFGIIPGGVSGRVVLVPSGYTSNSFISGTTTYANTTIAGMNLSGGTYTWSWGSGGTASTLVMTITP